LLLKGEAIMVNIDQLMPYTIGFDRMFNMLNRDFVPSTYPPYNIRKVGDYNFYIDMALAGFNKDDIDVKIADGELSVKSKVKNNDKEDTLYKGIAQRSFNKLFTLADDVEVKDAELTNGMLTISLEKIVPDEKKPRVIKIN
jgi:molecular chaperone IbpA